MKKKSCRIKKKNRCKKNQIRKKILFLKTNAWSWNPLSIVDLLVGNGIGQFFKYKYLLTLFQNGRFFEAILYDSYNFFKHVDYNFQWARRPPTSYQTSIRPRWQQCQPWSWSMSRWRLNGLVALRQILF